MSTGMFAGKLYAPLASVCAVTVPRDVVIDTTEAGSGTAVAAGLARPLTVPLAEANGPASRSVGTVIPVVPTVTLTLDEPSTCGARPSPATVAAAAFEVV